MNIINWADIVAECGNYKAAFVATFHKYEGMPTDERDGRGAVRVTRQSFADHMGIPERTFRRWVREADGSAESAELRAIEGKAGTLRSAKNMAKKDPGALVDAIEAAGPTAVDQVFYDLKLRRAGQGPLPKKPTKADAKAKKAKSAAVADAAVSGILTSLLQTIPAQLDEIIDDVEGAIAKSTMSAELLEKIEEAAQRLLNTVQAGKVFVS
jgi:hypothetical protein